MADSHAAGDEDRTHGILANGIAVAAFTIIMAIVIWGLLHIATLSTSWFSSLFAHRTPAATKTQSLPLPVLKKADAGAPQPAAPPVAAHNTPADIAVRILSISHAADQDGISTVEFDIANIGGTRSNAYTFTAYLPTAQGYTYRSQRQPPLGPGDHVVNTLHFSQGVPGTVTIVVEVSDGNQSNNTASQSF